MWEYINGINCSFFQGVLVASADESLVIAIYGAISSDFRDLSEGPFLMTAYTLGYCIGLPVVRDHSSLKISCHNEVNVKV